MKTVGTFVVGTRVRVMGNGPSKGLTGVIDKTDDIYRLVKFDTPRDGRDEVDDWFTVSELALADFSTIHVDEQALEASLYAIPCTGDYFEVIFKTEAGLPKKVEALFSAVRVLFQSPTYSIARLYIGNAHTSNPQYIALEDAYGSGGIVEYERVYPPQVPLKKDWMEN